MKTKKLPEMNEEEIRQLIKKQSLCRIAFREDPYPYISPFQYVVIDDVLYFHFTDYGKKIGFLRQDNPVCVEVEVYSPDFSKFAFVILQGKLKLVEDPSESSRLLYVDLLLKERRIFQKISCRSMAFRSGQNGRT